MNDEIAAAWMRWSVYQMPGPGNVWHCQHDCGYYVLADLGAGSQAIVDAERAHERTCR